MARELRRGAHALKAYSPWPKVRRKFYRGGVKGRDLSKVQTAARQASLSITNSRSLLRLMSIESVMPSSDLILCRPLLLLPQSLPASESFQ